MSEWRSRCFPYHPHCQLLCCPVLKTEPTAANTRPSKPSGPWVSGKILISIDETGYRNAQNIIHFLNLVVTKRSQYALGSYVPVFPIRSLFNPCVPSKKHLTCQKQSPKSVDFFQQSTTKQRKRYVLNMRNRKEVFFPCRKVPPLLWTLYRRRLSHHFLLCKVISFLAFVIQSEIQRNSISVIPFNSLGEHAKGDDVFSARCETATSKSEHSRKDVTVL